MNLYSTSQANGDSTHHSVSNCVWGEGGALLCKIGLDGRDGITLAHVRLTLNNLHAHVCV